MLWAEVFLLDRQRPFREGVRLGGCATCCGGVMARPFCRREADQMNPPLAPEVLMRRYSSSSPHTRGPARMTEYDHLRLGASVAIEPFR